MIHMIFIPKNLGGCPHQPSPSAASKHNSRHLLRCDLRSICRHRTGDLKMKGVVGPRGAGLELERRLPRSDAWRTQELMRCRDPCCGHHTMSHSHGYGIPTCPLFIRFHQATAMSDQMNAIQTWIEDDRRISKEMQRIYPRHIHGIAGDHTDQYLPLCPVLNCWFSLSIPIRQMRGAGRFPLHKPGRRRVFVQAENHSPAS